MRKGFYAQFVGPGDLAFDIGANVGNRTEVLLALGAAVVAVEPQPQCARRLQERFGGDPHFTLVEKAVGRAEGMAEMLLCDDDTLSTLNQEWLQRMQASRRFTEATWDSRIQVPVTTLDRLIAEFGIPAFCKIDTEGYEQEVLAGLSQPIPALSFEFAVETVDMTLWCIRRLSQLGTYAFNLSRGESMRWGLPRWLGAEALCEPLPQMLKGTDWGDIYARLTR